MIGLDKNVLLAPLLEDETAQAARAKRELERDERFSRSLDGLAGSDPLTAPIGVRSEAGQAVGVLRQDDSCAPGRVGCPGTKRP